MGGLRFRTYGLGFRVYRVQGAPTPFAPKSLDLQVERGRYLRLLLRAGAAETIWDPLKE